MLRAYFEQKVVNMIRYTYLLSRLPDDNRNQMAEIAFMGRKIPCRLILPYGLSTAPPRGSETIAFSILGNVNNSVGIATYPQNRHQNLKEWEVALGNQNRGSEIFFDEDANIDIQTASGDINVRCMDMSVQCEDININAQDITINCNNINMNASGTITLIAGGQTLSISSAGVQNNGTNIGSSHTHPAGNILDSANGQCTGNSGTAQ